ncbi:E3 ubiquitin-protein ligase MARCHF5-like isoform X1 [Centruroides vittatus]|uniref:E3 ubiquitin-protein ligase MARCHF5-like isoform X1 n=1 Tax=Centruroides vittatus TaxID=120091 RepID=UPI0035105E2A
MSSLPPSNTLDVRESDTESRRTCWVCLAVDDDDLDAEWLQPCQCRGTTKWVHQICLEDWIDSKQSGNSRTSVSCPQCNTEYIIIFPSLGTFVQIIDLTDRLIYRICPFVAAGVVIGSIYWTAVTYGAVTIMQVLGHKEGLSAMEQADPIFLLVGLPTIPLALIISKLTRWDDIVLNLWRKHSSRIPAIKYIFGEDNICNRERSPTERSAYSDPVSFTRLLCGALMLPTFASCTGKLFFGYVMSNLQRTIWGGVAFLMLKGIFKLYLRQKHYVRLCQRKILNYKEGTQSNQDEPNDN